MVFSWRRLRERATHVLHLDEEPSRLAMGMAVGVFIGVTPFYGLHTLLALAAAYVFRLNKAATITGGSFYQLENTGTGAMVLMGNRSGPSEAIQHINYELRETMLPVRLSFCRINGNLHAVVIPIRK